MNSSRPNTASGSTPVAAALNRTFSPAINVNADPSASAGANNANNANNKVIYMPWTDKDEVNEVTNNANTHNVADIIKRIGRRFASVGGIGESNLIPNLLTYLLTYLLMHSFIYLFKFLCIHSLLIILSDPSFSLSLNNNVHVVHIDRQNRQ